MKEPFFIGMNVEHIKNHRAGTVHAIARDCIKVAFVEAKLNIKEPNKVIYLNCKREELRPIQ